VRTPQAVLVAYRSPLWLKVAIGSFLAQFPDQEILVVDNNPRRSDPMGAECEAERQWLADHRRVRLLPNLADRTHGAGMDLASWCREHGVAATFGPIAISARRGYRELAAGIGAGARWRHPRKTRGRPSLSEYPSVADVRTSFAGLMDRSMSRILGSPSWSTARGIGERPASKCERRGGSGTPA
jgi:hypothetical protein